MFGREFQRKYALTDQGVRNTKKGAFWTVVVNLAVLAGTGILYLLMSSFVSVLTDDSPLPGIMGMTGLLLVFLFLSFLTHLQQYKATYGLVYNEVRATRLSLAERLRRLPLGYFGKRDVADLTETIMGDVNRMEHVWSHVLGYLYGSMTGGLPLPASGACLSHSFFSSEAGRLPHRALKDRRKQHSLSLMEYRRPLRI